VRADSGLLSYGWEILWFQIGFCHDPGVRRLTFITAWWSWRHRPVVRSPTPLTNGLASPWRWSHIERPEPGRAGTESVRPPRPA